MLGDFASLDVQNTYRGSDAYAKKVCTTLAHPEHKKYPYLLRDLEVYKPNQVWSTDITYIRLDGGFVYLAAVIDCALRHLKCNTQ
ncbi:hypothetical protein AVI53_01235 [Piscirickettsia salmonis]|nr:hypothetical protein PSLF89_05555 [Piscirickettsia salmonis LF-89 = ATCC VR-1361]ALY02621.1 hypothetical protein AWE47_06965 [Piscirickettsia salmonis]AMA42165.1 hypothetical protein AWJ11_07140 [Piscirickettsia salmonis]AOS34642.1 hypothetical protein AVM72_04315 [Piscirickettsia salmonis]APS59357.1 hypothetical protein AVI53_01235 [Piscirickettsia salmonis]